MLHDLGDTVSLAVTVRDDAGALADATSVTCTVTQPNGVAVAVATAHPATGSYTASFAPTQTGTHAVRWQATGANASAYADVFTVIDPATLGIVGLSQLKAHLNIAADDHDHDDELRAAILAASDAIGRNLHRPVRRETLTRTWVTLRGNGLALVLPRPDVAEVVSVSSGGRVLTADEYTPDLLTGVIYRPEGWSAPVTVTWTTAAVDTADIRQAVLEMCRHLWETQRGSLRANGLPLAGGTTQPGASYSLPNRVLELLAPARSHT